MNYDISQLDLLGTPKLADRLVVRSMEQGRDLGMTLEALQQLLKTDGSAATALYIFSPVPDVAALKAIDNTNPELFPDNWLIAVKGKGLYLLDRASFAVPNDDTIVKAAVGNWLAAGGGPASGSPAEGDFVSKSKGGTFDAPITVVGAVTATNFIKSSDRRLKKEIKPLSNPVEALMELAFYSYRWKESGQEDFGVIAQELEEVFPFMVQETASGTKAVNYTALFSLVAAGLQELCNRVTKLESNG